MNVCQSGQESGPISYHCKWPTTTTTGMKWLFETQEMTGTLRLIPWAI